MRRLLVRRAPAPIVAAAIALLGGCADRGLGSGPQDTTGAGTWIAVAIAALGITGVLAALVVVPARQPGGSTIASWVLALQAGGVAVAASVLVGAAVRSEQLLRRPPDAEQAASLLRLSTLDGGNGAFFDLVVAATVVLAALGCTTLVLAARCAADDDPLERTLATGLLALEVAGSVACGVLLAIGHRHLGFVLPALALPILVVATAAAWPRPPHADARPAVPR